MMILALYSSQHLFSLVVNCIELDIFNVFVGSLAHAAAGVAFA